MVPWHDGDFYIDRNRATATVSLLSAVASGLLGLPALVAVALVRMRDALLHAREALAAEAGAETRTLRPGKTVLRGTVTGDRGMTPPVIEVRIEQVGRQYAVKSGTRHRWTETGRTVRSQPFAVRLASGEEVRVEPGDEAVLVDHLDVVQGSQLTQRTRVARVLAGDVVYVEGNLLAPQGSAYRGGPSTFTLRPIRGRKMLVSVEPLEQRHQRRARVNGWSALALSATLLLLNAVLLGTFWRGVVSGKVESLSVANVTTWKTRAKNGTVTHFGVIPRAAPGVASTPLEVSAAAYAEAKSAVDKHDEWQMPVVALPGGDARWAGARPTLSTAQVMFSLVVLAFSGGLYVIRLRHVRPWYERSKCAFRKLCGVFSRNSAVSLNVLV